MRFLFLFPFLFCFLSPLLQAQEYIWPTNSGNYLSSTFGETRSEHFHAGLDIKTWGREGYEVYAAKDGILHRLMVTERGYGNAIYLEHADGTYTVYAHLQRFNAEFRAIADSIRFRDYSFEMDVILDTMQIKVKQGNVIGYTGSTGIGPPHLHFEIRDSLDNPINALTSNLSIKDELSPIFSSLIVEPITQQSRVEGKPVSHFMPAQPTNGTYNFGSVKLKGRAGLAVNVFDKANDVPNAYAVFSLALMHESDTLFYEELNQLSYEHTEEMFLDRIAPFGSSRRGHQRLYAKEGHNNPFYKITRKSAILSPEDSAKTYTIVAADYFGNQARATLTVEPDSRSTDKPQEEILQFPLGDWYWAEDWASPDLESTIDLTKDIKGFSWKNNQQLVRKDSATVVNFARLTPEANHNISTPDHRLLVTFPSNSFFDTMTVAASYQFNKEQVPEITAHPHMLPVKGHYGITFFLGDEFEAGLPYRLYQKDPDDGELDYERSTLIGRTVHGWPSELGEFVIKADTAAPKISDFKVYETDFGEWRASVDVRDELSGVDVETANFTVNGIRGIAEYDYEEELIIFYHPEFKPDSVNFGTLRVSDKAGNRALMHNARYPNSDSN